jgi:hypothetical protein
LRVRGNITIQSDWGDLNTNQTLQPGWLVENLELYGTANQTIDIATTRRTENVTVNKTGGTLTYSKAHAFGSFTCDTPGQALRFQALATFTVGALTIEGAVGNLVSIDRNGGSGTDQFTFAVTTGQAIEYVNLTNSLITEDSTVLDGVNGGNNTNWFFSETLLIEGDEVLIEGEPVHIGL